MCGYKLEVHLESIIQIASLYESLVANFILLLRFHTIQMNEDWVHDSQVQWKTRMIVDLMSLDSIFNLKTQTKQ